MLIKWPLIGFKNSYKNIETYIFSSMGYLMGYLFNKR